MATPSAILKLNFEQRHKEAIDALQVYLAEVKEIPKCENTRDWKRWKQAVENTLQTLRDQHKQRLQFQIEYARNLLEYHKLDQINSFKHPLQTVPYTQGKEKQRETDVKEQKQKRKKRKLKK